MKIENRTVDEVAKASRKTKRTVYNHLDRIKARAGDNLEQYLIVVDNIQYLTPKGQIEIYKSLGDTYQANKIQRLLDEDGKPQAKEDESDNQDKLGNQEENQRGNDTSEYIKSLRNQIKGLENQLERQNQQIDRLLEIVDTQSKQIALDTVNKDKEKKFIEAGYTTTENLQENNQNEKQENKKTFFEKFKDFFK